MYLPDSSANNSDAEALRILESIADAPQRACEDDPEARAAFEEGLRQLAEDIVRLNPSLAHMLIGMSESPCPVVHGQN